jgi:hypothetical protein
LGQGKARYKHIDTSPRFIAVDHERQLLPGTFAHALNHLIDRELDLSGFDTRYRNDLNGACPGRRECCSKPSCPATARASTAFVN